VVSKFGGGGNSNPDERSSEEKKGSSNWSMGNTVFMGSRRKLAFREGEVVPDWEELYVSLRFHPVISSVSQQLQGELVGHLKRDHEWREKITSEGGNLLWGKA